MIELLERNREAIAQACRRHRVARLEVFGSAADGRFVPARSDVDFLVTFAFEGPSGIWEAYFGLKQDLESLLGLPVDLVTERSVQNPYLRKGIAATRELLYAA